MRPSLDQTYMDVARIFAKRSTCPRRQVGCVIVGKGYIMSAGYNGQYAGAPHCVDNHCPGAGLASGTGLDLCLAAHAEQNAIARLRDPFEADTLYCTTCPCISCTKLVLCTGIKRIVAADSHPQSGKELWISAGREWVDYAAT